MKRQFKIFLFLILTVHTAKGQSIYFNNVYDFGNSEFTHSVLPIDSGYLIAGVAGNPKEAALFKINYNGNLLWSKNYLWSNTNTIVGRKALVSTYDGNYALTGSQSSANGRTGLLLKINENGDTLWSKTYSNDSVFACYNLKQTLDSGFIIVGYTDSVSYWGDFLVIKTDSLGSREWTKVIVAGASHDEARVVEITNDGGYIIGGTKYIGNEGYGHIVKINSLGNIQWQLTTGGAYGGQINDIKQTSDSSFIVCGGFNDNFDTGNALSYGQCYIAKVSTSGIIQWQKKYGTKGYTSYFNSIQLVNDGYVFAGNKGEISISIADGFILKTNFTGDSIWARIYNKFGNNYQDMLEDIKSTSDGGFIAGGWFYPANQNMWVMKLDSLGCDTIGCQFVGVEEEEELSPTYLNIYPNPVYGSTTIEWLPGEQLPATVKIINMMGQTVIIKNILAENYGRETIHLAELPQGIYLLSLTTEEKTVTRKFIKQ